MHLSLSCMLRNGPLHYPLFDNCDYVWRRVQIIMLLVMHFSINLCLYIRNVWSYSLHSTYAFTAWHLIKRLRTRNYLTFAGVRPTCTAHLTGIKQVQSRVLTLSGKTHVTTYEILAFSSSHIYIWGPMPVTEPPKACVCRRPLAVIAGSNPAGVIHVCLL
jgi:hypothetical protein